MVDEVVVGSLSPPAWFKPVDGAGFLSSLSLSSSSSSALLSREILSMEFSTSSTGVSSLSSALSSSLPSSLIVGPSSASFVALWISATTSGALVRTTASVRSMHCGSAFAAATAFLPLPDVLARLASNRSAIDSTLFRLVPSWNHSFCWLSSEKSAINDTYVSPSISSSGLPAHPASRACSAMSSPSPATRARAWKPPRVRSSFRPFSCCAMAQSIAMSGASSMSSCCSMSY
mmetsp:Transcript_17983/g.49881  ORF Transcript_17983/g.49881 Transcript_17983/m.49881 type:complete len:232 (+) Transcript_17983:1012-1707(+)